MPVAPKKELSLFDSTSIIVGIIIGAGIYQMAPAIAGGARCWWGVFAIWIAGGLLSLCGALGYAELATAYPKEGGDYVYLNRAYGRWAGYLFGWIQLTIVRPGDIAVMAFAFATYARTIYDVLPGLAESYNMRIYAAAATIVLTTINILGVKEGKWTQNILTTVKALGLLAIVAAALLGPKMAVPTIKPVLSWVEGSGVEKVDPIPVSLALIFVLFVYGGWNEMAYVAAEVRDPKRNISRALVLGTAAVMVLYLLVNGAFLHTLGYEGMVASKVVATDSISTVFPKIGGKLISALVCISALGAANGLIFTGARISYAMGTEHRLFRALGNWHPRTGTPLWALLVQGLVALTFIVVFGSFVDTLLYAAVAVYSFYLATNLAVIFLRFKEPKTERPFKVTGYPFTTLIFCVACAMLIHSSISYALANKRPYLVILACTIVVGILLYLLTDRRLPRQDQTTANEIV